VCRYGGMEVWRCRGVKVWREIKRKGKHKRGIRGTGGG
jgi:hypothetical protein